MGDSSSLGRRTGCVHGYDCEYVVQYHLVDPILKPVNVFEGLAMGASVNANACGYASARRAIEESEAQVKRRTSWQLSCGFDSLEKVS